MTESGSMPESIAYLKPAIDFFDSLPPEELNEDTDTDLLYALIGERIAGCSVRKARKLLKADRQQIEDLPDEVKDANPGLCYVLGSLLLPELADAILNKDSEPEIPYPQVIVDLPDNLQPNRRRWSIDIKSGSLVGTFQAMDQMSFDHMNWGFDHTPTSHKDFFEFKIEDVTFGKITGRKRTLIEKEQFYWKTVDYLLDVAGGYVHLTLDGGGKDFDESVIEPYLHTVEVKS